MYNTFFCLFALTMREIADGPSKTQLWYDKQVIAYDRALSRGGGRQYQEAPHNLSSKILHAALHCDVLKRTS
ncbi:hypothetical protein HMI54_011729 [Coelomomyces lativittatus]|nr:hypothetical protein HMI54_011729 [Coelomomyces lativittatus]